MIRNYRLRKSLRATAGLQKALLMLFLGVIALFLGAGLAFKRLILPMLVWLSDLVRNGVAQFVGSQDVDMATWALGSVMLLLGVYATFRAVRMTFNHIFETLNPDIRQGKIDLYMRRLQLAQGPRVVAIGGGTGLSTLLRGLKQHTSNITAIVTVTDDGGSSGRLIKEKGMIPPGDIRNCLVALADAERAMTDLFQHRFKKESGSLSGHALGNLLIAGLVDQAQGDFEKAIEIASDVLNIRGRVIPSTLANVRLRAELEDGTEICGETQIVEARKRIKKLHLDPEDCAAHEAAIEAICAADLICIGPGSVFTSVIPNLLVPGVAEALKKSAAKKVYICNVMTQPGESDDFAASEHVSAILRNVEERVFDYVVVNTGIPSESALEKYRESGQYLVEADIDRVRAMGFRVLQGNVMSETDVVRHDPMKVAARAVAIADR